MAKLILEQYLKRKRISKYRFAKLAGESYKNTPRLFSPKYDVKLSRLTRWAKALGCRVRDLIKED